MHTHKRSFHQHCQSIKQPTAVRQPVLPVFNSSLLPDERCSIWKRLSMAQMIISRNSRSGKASINATEAVKKFSGQVWLDPVLSGEELSVANVNFTPSARTFWHRHEGGQLVRVIAGSGWICDRGGAPQRIDVGDVIWCPPGTIHWHGADEDSYMVHQVVTHGKVEWYDAVTEEEYEKRKD